MTRNADWLLSCGRGRRLGLLMAGTALTGMGLAIPTDALAQCVAATCTVASESDLRTAIAYANTNANTTINLTSGVTLTTGDLPALQGAGTTINGNGNTLSGGNTYRGLFVYSGSTRVEDLTITNALAQGGNSPGRGGGGAGLGGALFVNSGATVTVSNVNLQNNQAAGGSTTDSWESGGGGMGGNGGLDNGGGGGLGRGATGGSNTDNGSAGIVAGAASGGGSGVAVGGINGGGGAGNNTVGGGGGGIGGTGPVGFGGGAAGFGGGGGGAGGGIGGAGGFGGGGGGSGSHRAGAGGFGGGGGAGAIGGGGGFGGGNGAANLSTGGGGGGAGMGGAIFVVEGGNLIIEGPLNVAGGGVAGGLGTNGGGNGSAFGSGLFLQGNGTLTFQPGTSTTQTIADVIADQTGSGGSDTYGGGGPSCTVGVGCGSYSGTGSWGLNKNGAGTLVLSATNTYSGATAVNAGTLVVDGSIANSATTVNSGGLLRGIGSMGSTAIASGGTFAPGSGTAGSSMAVQGNLAFASGAAYLVQVNPATTSSATVTGTATLDGTVNAQFAAGAYATNNYTVLTATGGFGGTTFGGFIANNLPAGFAAHLSYSSNNVILSLAAVLGFGGGLNQDQQNVANTLNSYFNNGGTLPPGFVTVFGLTGQALGNALTQLSGQHATGIQPAANLSTNLFLNAMIDPFATGRTGGFGAAMGYAQDPSPSRVAVAARDAFAADMPVKAPVPYVAEQRWSVWGAAYGGRNRTDGDAAIGSNDLSATAAGFAAGADYRVSPDSVIGAAVAIGETRWNVSALGKGNADVAQIGGYFSSRWNSLYVSGAASIGWHRASTDRTLTIAGTDRLEADFNATSFGGRLEGGYRYGSVAYGVTPYAAVQVTGIRTPAYAETASAGLNQFALSYRAQSVNDIRSELGFWADTRHALGNGALVVLRGRAAWVHDYNPGSRVQAAFQTLPGTSFVVDGAAAPRDAALTSAVAELRMTNGWSLISKFDGEFSGHSRTVAGTGTVKYAW